MTDSSSNEHSGGVSSGLIKTGRVLFAVVFVALVVSNLMLQQKVRLLKANLHSATLTLLRRGMLHVGEPLPDIALESVSGGKTTLLQASTASPLIFFVDPDCDACKEMIADAGKVPSPPAMAFISVPRPGSSAVLHGLPPASTAYTVSPAYEARLRSLIGRVPRVLLVSNGQPVRLCDKLPDCLGPVTSAAR
jgi:hypothetical protein